jgi:hypothetical protein
MDWLTLLGYGLLLAALLAFLSLVGLVSVCLIRDLANSRLLVAGDSGTKDNPGTSSVTAPRKPTPPVLSGSEALPVPKDSNGR